MGDDTGKGEAMRAYDGWQRGAQGTERPGPLDPGRTRLAAPAGRWRPTAGGALQGGLVLVLVVLVCYPLAWIFFRGLQGPDGGLAIREFLGAYATPKVLTALRNSLAINLTATVLAGVLGSFLAWAVVRTSFPGRRAVEKLVVVPFITMTLVGAFSWVVLAAPRSGLLNLILGPLGISLDIYSRWGIVFVMTVYFLPFVFLFVAGALRRVDPSLEDASVACGRSRVASSIRITLPLAAPAILAALILTFALTMEEFGVFAVLATPQGFYVLPTLIERSMSAFPADYVSASAVAALLLALTALMVLLQRRLLSSRRSFVTVGGREFRPAPLRLRPAARAVVTAACWGYIAVSVFLPALGLLTVSLYEVWTAKLTTDNLSLDNYLSLLADTSVRDAAWNSFVLSLLASVVALTLTTTVAYLLHRRRTRTKGLLVFLTTVPVAVPGIVFAVGVFHAYINPPLVLYGTIWILFVAYVGRHLPYGMRAVEGSLEQLHEDLERSARVCGASQPRTFMTVVLPLIAPGMLAGGTIMFIAMMRELSSSILLYSSGNVVNSVLMLEMYGQGNIGRLAAYTLLLMAATVAVVALVQRVTKVDLGR